jgi:transposase-like protein
MTGNSNRFSREVRERAVRMMNEHRGEYGSEWEGICSIASKIGCTAETLRRWIRRAERIGGSRISSGKCASCARPTRSCARRPRILPRRSSTAGSGHDRIHRRSSRGLRGRADLQGAADRPISLSRILPSDEHALLGISTYAFFVKYVSLRALRSAHALARIGISTCAFCVKYVVDREER